MGAEERVLAGGRGGASRAADGRVELTLVVPTRNEAENVAKLARGLRESLMGVSYRLVFVDDSTDGTPQEIRALQGHDGHVDMIHREHGDRAGGLSTAVTTGMEAFSGMSEFTCVMDADLQHPPEKVREMLEIARQEKADVVVASRYAKGGDYEGLSGPLRRAVSLGSKFLAQVVFKEARKTSDPMTGFFLVRNGAISGIQFRPTGFKVLLEILVCAPELKVVEAPFSFRARNAGVSKATLRQGLEYLLHTLSLFWYVPSAGRFWKFAMVGASGVLVNMATLVVLAEVFDAHKVIAWMFAVGLSILSNFLLNNAFTWRDVRHSSRIHFFLRGALAYPVAILGIGANFAVYYPLLKYVSDAFPYYVFFNLLGILAGTSVNFILSSRLVFRPNLPANLDPHAPPREISSEIRSELRADWVGLVRLPDLSTPGDDHELAAADRALVDLVASTGQPTLAVTGPRRLPQARTNARFSNSLAVPVFAGPDPSNGTQNGVPVGVPVEVPVGVVYATRLSTEPFTQEDLHWLTAYASTAAPVFG